MQAKLSLLVILSLISLAAVSTALPSPPSFDLSGASSHFVHNLIRAPPDDPPTTTDSFDTLSSIEEEELDSEFGGNPDATAPLVAVTPTDTDAVPNTTDAPSSTVTTPPGIDASLGDSAITPAATTNVASTATALFTPDTVLDEAPSEDIGDSEDDMMEEDEDEEVEEEVEGKKAPELDLTDTDEEEEEDLDSASVQMDDEEGLDLNDIPEEVADAADRVLEEDVPATSAAGHDELEDSPGEEEKVTPTVEQEDKPATEPSPTTEDDDEKPKPSESELDEQPAYEDDPPADEVAAGSELGPDNEIVVSQEVVYLFLIVLGSVAILAMKGTRAIIVSLFGNVFGSDKGDYHHLPMHNDDLTDAHGIPLTSPRTAPSRPISTVARANPAAANWAVDMSDVIDIPASRLPQPQAPCSPTPGSPTPGSKKGMQLSGRVSRQSSGPKPANGNGNGTITPPESRTATTTTPAPATTTQQQQQQQQATGGADPSWVSWKSEDGDW